MSSKFVSSNAVVSPAITQRIHEDDCRMHAPWTPPRGRSGGASTRLELDGHPNHPWASIGALYLEVEDGTLAAANAFGKKALGNSAKVTSWTSAPLL